MSAHGAPSFAQLCAALARRLAEEPLPGPRSQITMAPSERALPDPAGEVARAGRRAAALALLYLHHDQPHVALTRRSAGLRDHGGQISLPGGRIEPGEGRRAAALREAREELAVAPDEVELLGELTPLWIPPSDFVVHTLVAAAPRRPDFRPQPSEVEALIEAPLALLLDPQMRREESGLLRGRPRQIPFFDVGGEQVWGATAMILAELLAVWRSAAAEVDVGVDRR